MESRSVMSSQAELAAPAEARSEPPTTRPEPPTTPAGRSKPRRSRNHRSGDQRSEHRRAEARAVRRAAMPPISYPPELPVSQRRDEIAQAIRDHQVVIIAGET